LNIKTIFVSVFLAAVALPAAAFTITGRIVGVHDGDTVTLLDDAKRQHRIRLAQIDAPELRQPFGERSKQSLSELVYGQTVRAECSTTDRYGRSVCTIFVGGMDANLEQVRRGMAWVYRQYSNDATYLQAEETARAQRVGLWSQANPQQPWNYRNGGKSATSSSSAQSDKPPCGAKRTCREMTSCEEAMHYLRDCGVSSLDRDRDGVPCETLCRR